MHTDSYMTKQTILLVEDDPILSDAFSLNFAKSDYDLIHAANGQLALDILRDKKVDIILLDLLMPVMDGKEFLRQYDNPDNIPIIVFSNIDSKTDVEEVLSLGATRYMLKAWASPREIRELVRDTISQPTS